MSLTAFIPTGAPQILPFIGTPGAATVGHALVWSEAPQGFTLSPITVGPDQFSGVLPVSKGGWGSNTGSFTSPGAITLAAGGTNQNINLNPSGTGDLTISRRTVIGPSIPATASPASNSLLFVGESANSARGMIFANNQAAVQVVAGSIPYAYLGSFNDSPVGITANNEEVVTISTPANLQMNCGSSFFRYAFRVWSSLESTSTTTGAVVVDGGLGVAKNVNIGGNLKVSGTVINFSNLPSVSTGLNSGDLWRDSSGFLRVV